ncbi:MAG: hypothetical protein AVO39_05720 [delta proteobacterium MLS_D]|nr:MAG: hypothetical protein AVO39_05720 [delta proteobacterium MLS_D]
MSKLYLFDFDGVIVDSLTVYREFVASCLEKIDASLSFTAEDFLELFDDNFYEAIAARNIPVDVFMKAAATIAPVDYTKMRPFPDVVPIVKELSRENLLVVISSNQSEPIEQVLKQENMSGFFRDVLGADHMTSKTDKINHAMKTWKNEPGETFYIGDTAGDVREARKAGVRSVAVTWGWHSEERLRAAGPDYIVRTPRDLIALDGRTVNS